MELRDLDGVRVEVELTTGRTFVGRYDRLATDPGWLLFTDDRTPVETLTLVQHDQVASVIFRAQDRLEGDRPTEFMDVDDVIAPGVGAPDP